MEDFTFDVYKDVKATNNAQLKHDKGLREHAKTIHLPDIEFDPQKDKEIKRLFKIITFEFAEAEGADEDEVDIPELGLTTFQITTKIARLDKPQCNKTSKASPFDCPPVTRKANMEFFSVPFDKSKSFHRTYGQLNSGFDDDGDIKEQNLIFHNNQMGTAMFDYPDTEYPELGITGDVHVDLYGEYSHTWTPRCNRKENHKECIKHATCGAKIKGRKDDSEKMANFCCLCVPGKISSPAFPTPCGVNITRRYEDFLQGNMECGKESESCPYFPNPMSDVKCRKTLGSCPITCKCGSPRDMENCIHPFTKKPKYPLYPNVKKDAKVQENKSVKEVKAQSPKRRNGVKNDPDQSSASLRLGIGIGVVVINAVLAAILC